MADLSWRTAESREEFIHDIVEGTLKVLEKDSDLAAVFEGSEFEDLAGSYDRNGLYGNPLTDMTHNSLKDKTVPENTVECLKQTDDLYEGVARATKSGVEQIASKSERSIDGMNPGSIFKYIIGIAKAIADHIEIKPWVGGTDAVFFNDPTYITSVQ